MRGRGVHAQLMCNETLAGFACDPAARSRVHARGSLFEDNHDIALLVAASDATVDTSVVRRTAPRAADGVFGDGVVVVVTSGGTASATITSTRIEESARAAIASFGGQVVVAGSRIACSAFGLTGERKDDRDFVIADAGGNLCGCPDAEGPCKVISVGLEPPEALVPR
jgi:hypothetical protein